MKRPQIPILPYPKSRIWALLSVTVLSFGLFMSQRPTKKNPSPADPGMRMATPSKHRQLESSDPDAGDVPNTEHEDQQDIDDKDDNKSGTYHDIEETIPVLPIVQIDSIVLLRVASGSEFGKTDDWMLAVYGEGFIDAESRPLVHLGSKLILTEVFVNQSGTILYATLPASIAAQWTASEFKEIAVQNPGGLNRNPALWGHLVVNKEKIKSSLQNAVRARFKRGPLFLEKLK